MIERIEKLKTFLQINPADSFIKHALALEYVKRGNFPEARLLFEELLDREPGYIGSYYHLAKLLEDTGEKDLALQWYQKGMEAAGLAGDNHAYGELQSAYENLAY
jgi:Tfp pilus assembly protein PilF